MITLLHRRASALFLLLLVSFVLTSTAQFGVPRNKHATTDGPPIDNESENLTSLTEKDATNIAALIEASKEDPETLRLIESLKKENAEELEELRNLPDEEILDGLKLSLDELLALDHLFSDRDRAFEEIQKEGLIADENVKKYQDNPALLEEDMRNELYFHFISLAVVAGFL